MTGLTHQPQPGGMVRAQADEIDRLTAAMAEADAQGSDDAA